MDSNGNSEPADAVEPSSGLSPAAIRQQLDRILASPDFHATDKMRDFLRFIVEEKLAGRSQELKGYTIALAVFGRGEDFDATNDPIVRIQAGRLRRALDRYYLAAGARDPILIDIPKGRYIPRFSRLPGQADHPHRQAVRETAAHPDRSVVPSVAVLPFHDLIGGDDRLALATGLTEELITELARFQDIAVIACNAPGQSSGLPADPVEVGRTTGARFVLEGTLRRDTETEKVSAHLVDTRNGQQVWAEAFSHPLQASRLIATQEEIASQVVSAVASEYGIIARRLSSESRKKAPTELQTYETMLRYYDYQISPSPAAAKMCLAALRLAAEREPEYGPLWSALATIHCQLYTFDAPGADHPLDTAVEYARRGVFLEPGSQLGRLILAYASYLADDVDAFHEESQVALSLNPNSPYTNGSLGYMHVLLGEVDIGLPLLDSATSCNPCHPVWFLGGYVIDQLLHDDYE
ncbi:MAG: hypothetical protein P8172_16265, partial [Gammaproteobacteria bacterium]